MYTQSLGGSLSMKWHRLGKGGGCLEDITFDWKQIQLHCFPAPVLFKSLYVLSVTKK